MVFTGKVAIVTGSSMGIGYATAIALLSRGAKVVINGRDEIRLKAAQSQLKEMGYETLAIAADISKPGDCEKLVLDVIARLGRIDILVNNAAVSMEGEVESLDPSVFLQVFATNTLGPALMTRAATPYLQESTGSVMFVSSLAALCGLPRFSAYCASKTALTPFTQALREEVRKHNIHVGIAYLGFTENDNRKTILGPNGQPVAQPIRKGFKYDPVDLVAEKLVQMIEQRKDEQIFTAFGKFMSLLIRLAPGFVNWYVRRAYHRYLKNLELEQRIELGKSQHSTSLPSQTRLSKSRRA